MSKKCCETAVSVDRTSDMSEIAWAILEVVVVQDMAILLEESVVDGLQL